MSTDVQILTAAREVAAAHKAVSDADAAKLEADRKQDAAAKLCQDARSRYTAAEKRLLDLSRAKPAEPAPQPVVVTPPTVTTTPPTPAPAPKPAAAPANPAPVPNLNAPRRHRAAS